MEPQRKNESKVSEEKRISKLSERRSKKYSEQIFLLTERFRAGDLEAFIEVLITHSSLIQTVASKYENQGLSLDELVIFGKIGLIKAAHRYDNTKGVHFRTYAIWWIRQSILKALQEKARIDQVPEILIANLFRVSQTFGDIHKINEREPSSEEMHDMFNAQIEELTKVREKRNKSSLKK